jgi:deoxycytidylate deaminase
LIEARAINTKIKVTIQKRTMIFGSDIPMSVLSKWDERYLALAKEVSTWSKDPSTQVGAVTVGSKKEVLSQGFNGFVRLYQTT